MIAALLYVVHASAQPIATTSLVASAYVHRFAHALGAAGSCLRRATALSANCVYSSETTRRDSTSGCGRRSMSSPRQGSFAEATTAQLGIAHTQLCDVCGEALVAELAERAQYCPTANKRVCSECAVTTFVNALDCSEGCIFCNGVQWESNASYVCSLHITTTDRNGVHQLRETPLPAVHRNWRAAIECAIETLTHRCLPGRFHADIIPQLDIALRNNCDDVCTTSASGATADRRRLRTVSSGFISIADCSAFVVVKCAVVFTRYQLKCPRRDRRRPRATVQTHSATPSCLLAQRSQRPSARTHSCDQTCWPSGSE